MDDFEIVILFDNNETTIKKHFNTKTDMYAYYESISKIYKFRSVSISERLICCNVASGGFDYVWG